MGSKPSVSWHSADKSLRIGGGAHVAPGSGVALRSSFHREIPSAYQVFEVVPKCYWKLRFDGRTKLIHELPAVRAEDDGRYTKGQYESEPPAWAAPFPLSERGKMVLRACSDPEQGWSSDLTISTLRLSEVRDTRNNKVSVKAAGAIDLFEFGPTAATERTVERVYQGAFVRDPEVRISVLQGASLLQYLEDQASEFEVDHSFAEHLGDDFRYFADEPLDRKHHNVTLDEQDEFRAMLRIPVTEGGRFAWALQVEVIEWPDDSPPPTIVTDVQFLTAVGDVPIVSDVPPSLIEDQTVEMYTAFDDHGRDLEAFSRFAQLEQDDAWELLATAAEEVGVESVDEAADFVRLAAIAGQTMMMV